VQQQCITPNPSNKWLDGTSQKIARQTSSRRRGRCRRLENAVRTCTGTNSECYLSGRSDLLNGGGRAVYGNFNTSPAVTCRSLGFFSAAGPSAALSNLANILSYNHASVPVILTPVVDTLLYRFLRPCHSSPPASAHSVCLVGAGRRNLHLYMRARVKIKRDRQSGGQPSGLALPDKGRGIWGMGALIQLPSFEDGDARLASVLWDSGASALAYSLLP
jgi:hypothetical protein